MIVILGASGYVGQAFACLLRARGVEFVAPTRQQLDYTQYGQLVELLRSARPEFLINAAGYTGKPNVDACEAARADALQGNTLLPLTISHACEATCTPWGHVSSGCIYTGAIVDEGGRRRVEPDLTTPAMQELVATNRSAIHDAPVLNAPVILVKNEGDPLSGL